MLKAARFVSLMIVALLVGNEFSIWFVIHPALSKLSPPVHIASVAAIGRSLNVIAPVWMILAILSLVSVLFLIRNRKSLAFRLTLAAVGCIVATVV